MVDWLDGPEAMGAGHGELEAGLQVRSQEHYRLLLQGHLLERARREERRSGVTGSDGVPRPRVENGHRRELTSVFGPVSVTRKAYRAVPGIVAGAGTPAPIASATVPDPVPVSTGPTAAGTAAATSTSTGNGTSSRNSAATTSTATKNSILQPNLESLQKSHSAP